MTEIYVIRHVQAEGNLYRHMQGHWDGDVTSLGVRQRDALAERFREIPVDVIWSSDLYRARFTATAVTKYHPELTVQTDRRLREISVGPWEAVPFANAIWEQPELFDTFIHDQEHFYLDGAETYHQVQERATEALYEIADTDSPFEIGTVESKYAAGSSAESGNDPEYADEWATLHIRYKEPDADESTLMDTVITDAQLTGEMDDDFSWAAGVAQAGMILKGSEYAGDTDLSDVRRRLKSLTGNDEFREEFVYLLTRMSQGT